MTNLARGAMLVAVALLVASPPAGAAVQYLSVNWTGGEYRTIHYLFDGVSKTTRVGVSDGWLGAQHITNLYCCDLFEPAPQGEDWDVREYTEADGLAGWATPVVGTDHWRDHGNLRRAAWLCNTFGVGGSSAERVALNVAIWKASYGDRFNYVDGLDPIAQTAYDDYIAAYGLGHEADNYRWLDNAYDDQRDRRQDFITPPVPEPGTIMLFGSALLGSGLVFRRRHS